jgi:dipicolinate synthase subunit A
MRTFEFTSHIIITGAFPVIFLQAVNEMKITFIGGDERMLFAAGLFSRDGIETRVCGFDINTEIYGNVKNFSSVREALSGADTAVLPIPYSKDGKTVFAPFSEKNIGIEEVAKALGEKTLLIGGMTDGSELTGAVDICARDDFAILNAVPTAEGAVSTLLKETKRTASGMNVAVLGFGRVGAVLAKTLVSLGAKVTVFARKASARAWAKVFFCEAENFSALHEKIGGFDCIFNTVPHKIMFAEHLARIKKGAVIIELASAPGGADAKEVALAGARLVPAQGLPGKTAPRSAGKIIYETVKEITEEEYR